MKVVFLSKEQFDTFSNNHPLHTMYQSSMYGNLMEKQGYQTSYYGFIDDNNNLIGATLILYKNLFANFKYAYAPRGFLVNYDNRGLIKEISDKFRLYLAEKKFIFLKIDPPVINNKRDKNGNIIPSQYANDLIPYFKSIGYSYFGENKFFGTLKPRWNAILKVTGSSTTLFNNLDRSVKNKIRKAQSRGVEIIQGNHQDIEIFYNFVAKKHYRNLKYYQDLAECFKDKFELYFAKLNTENYLKNIKLIYEEEITKNRQINNEIQTNSINGKKITEKLTNSKITSDKLLAVYKKELISASQLFESNPQGIIIGATSVIIEKHGVELLIEGQDTRYNLFYPSFLLKWHIIEKYAKLGAIYFDLNAITGQFTDNNKFHGLNEMKLGFNADVTEYIGEFDLIIRKNLYNLYRNTRTLNKKIMKQSK